MKIVTTPSGKKEWNKKRKEPEESLEESGDFENKEMWQPIVVWEDYEDEMHRKRAIVMIVLPAGVDQYKMIPDTKGKGVIVSVRVLTFVMDSTRVLGSIYSDLPSYHPKMIALEKGIKELKENSLETDGCWKKSTIKLSHEVIQILQLDAIWSTDDCRVVVSDCLYKMNEVSALSTTGFLKENDENKRRIVEDDY